MVKEKDTTLVVGSKVYIKALEVLGIIVSIDDVKKEPVYHVKIGEGKEAETRHFTADALELE